jgi:hypothetical protein
LRGGSRGRGFEGPAPRLGTWIRKESMPGLVVGPVFRATLILPGRRL